ncbi:MAG: hypothetical protein HC847_16030 [Hydrococcus sp. RU_2_2]|nr:hypothetical protein [Hydrococcus sp. RU_2_2]
MNQAFVASSQDEPKFNAVEMLEQFSNAWANGYLKVISNTIEWKIYLNSGKLIYATHSVDPFDRLERHLRRLSQEIPILTNTVRQQVRLNFENQLHNDSFLPPDYRAIEWLVEQLYIKAPTAANLLKKLSQEVFESYLLLKKENPNLLAISLTVIGRAAASPRHLCGG